MKDILLKLILLISPLAYMAGRAIDSFDLVVFHIGFILLFISAQFLTNKPIQLKVFSIFLLAVLACTALSGLKTVSVFALLNLTVALCVVQLMSIESYKKFANIFLIASIINIALCFFPTISPIDNPTGESGGLFGNAPRLCYYLALTMPFVVDRYTLTLPAYALLGVVFKEIYLVAFATFILFAKLSKLKYRKTIFTLLSVVMLAIFYKDIAQSFSIRWTVWQPTIIQALQQPVFGYGLATFPQVSTQFIKSYWTADDSFSSMLQFFFSCGFIGLTALAYCVRQFLPIKLTPPATALIFLSILSLVEYPFEVPKLWLTICFILSAFIIEKNELQKGALNAVN